MRVREGHGGFGREGRTQGRGAGHGTVGVGRRQGLGAGVQAHLGESGLGHAGPGQPACAQGRGGTRGHLASTRPPALQRRRPQPHRGSLLCWAPAGWARVGSRVRVLENRGGHGIEQGRAAPAGAAPAGLLQPSWTGSPRHWGRRQASHWLAHPAQAANLPRLVTASATPRACKGTPHVVPSPPPPGPRTLPLK